jgi:hypothetical protein
MTTKRQEREALQKIREIVEALGEDSYIGTAFEGVFETAEDNIENDFACSLAQQVRSFKDMSAKLTALNKEHTATIEKLRKENVLLAGRLHDYMDAYEQQATELREEREAIEKRKDELFSGNLRLNNQISDMEEEAAQKDLEIMKLKARLYDLMTKEEA